MLQESAIDSLFSIDSHAFYSSLYTELRLDLLSSLPRFIRAAWPLVEPQTPLKWNWHLDEMCAAYEDMSRGYIKRLIVNVPPGASKSSIFSVFGPAWEWAQNASLRFLTVSYSDKLTIRDNRKVRDIVTSPWFKRIFWTEPENIDLAIDQSAKVRFDTTLKGWRIASSVGGHGLGEHPDRIILDDLLKAQDARSDVEIDNVNAYLQNTISTRTRRDPAIVLIMQRLHERDATDFLISKGGWTHITFPMRFVIPYQDNEGKWQNGYPCPCHSTRPDPLDHRTEEGELLWPEELTEEKVEAEESFLGPIDAAGQLQQNPSLKGGTLYTRDMFEIVDELPAEARSCPSARGWDTADTDIDSKNAKRADWTCGVKMVGPIDGIVYVTHVIRFKGNSEKVDRTIINTAKEDGKSCKIREGEGSGKATINRRTQSLFGYDYEPSPEKESKIQRNNPMRVQAKAGNIKLLRGEWNTAYLDVLTGFPNARYDDDVDASSNAFNALSARPKKRVRYSLGR